MKGWPGLGDRGGGGVKGHPGRGDPGGGAVRRRPRDGRVDPDAEAVDHCSGREDLGGRSLKRRRQGLSGSDRGSATIWSLGAIAVLCVVFGAVLALGQAVVVRHRAAGGADLAALAAADHWAEGGAEACARAERVAAAQGARLVRCAIAGETSDVTAASGRGPFAAEVRARAGPAGPVPPGPVPSAVPGEAAAPDAAPLSPRPASPPAPPATAR
ncbi:Rv3654c family TadE-like protein [Streptomyces sp. NPDC085866]|uniref:Rv3654c family TadE-like protein n=1 Tax=Streptomyces sp. NPDC085866 TaxID=3365736 RepID=UPI0037D08714